jgi:hypothetical protein
LNGDGCIRFDLKTTGGSSALAYIELNSSILDGNPEFPGWIRLRSSSSPARPRLKEGDEVTDEWGHGVSGARKKKGCRCSLRSNGLAQSKGRRGDQAVGPSEREFRPREKQADCWTTRPPGREGKFILFFSSFFSFYLFVCLFSNYLKRFKIPNKIK